jgi:hypothetical protein
MSGTINESIQPLKEDERLTIDRKFPTFCDQAQQVSFNKEQQSANVVVDEAKLTASLQYDLSLMEGWGAPYHKQRLEDCSFKNQDRMSPTPKRKYPRRNSKTAAMLQASTISAQHPRYQQRNDAVTSMLSPLLKEERASLFKLDLPMDEQCFDASLSAPMKKRQKSDSCEKVSAKMASSCVGIESRNRSRSDTLRALSPTTDTE